MRNHPEGAALGSPRSKKTCQERFSGEIDFHLFCSERLNHLLSNVPDDSRTRCRIQAIDRRTLKGALVSRYLVWRKVRSRGNGNVPVQSSQAIRLHVFLGGVRNYAPIRGKVAAVEKNKLERLRSLADTDDHAVYEAIKAGKVGELSHEGQLEAKAIEEHLNFPGVHNALEFGDLRDGQPFELEDAGQPVSPLAHIAAHAVILGMLETNSDARAAVESLKQERAVSEHHAIHVLSALVLGYQLIAVHGRNGLEKDERDLLKGDFEYALKRICRDPRYRYRLTRRFGPAHWE